MNKEIVLIPAIETTVLNKTEQANQVNALVEKVMEGEVNPVDAFLAIKSISEVVSQFLKNKDVVDATVNEVQKYGREGLAVNGTKLVVAETGVKYIFDECSDPEWNELVAERAAIDAKIKEREAFLKKLSHKTTIINEETGEVNEIYPPARTSSTSIKVTFAK